MDSQGKTSTSRNNTALGNSLDTMGKDLQYKMAQRHSLLEARRSAPMLVKHTTLEEVPIQRSEVSNQQVEHIQLLEEVIPNKTHSKRTSTRPMA